MVKGVVGGCQERFVLLGLPLGATPAKIVADKNARNRRFCNFGFAKTDFSRMIKEFNNFRHRLLMNKNQNHQKNKCISYMCFQCLQQS